MPVDVLRKNLDAIVSTVGDEQTARVVKADTGRQREIARLTAAKRIRLQRVDQRTRGREDLDVVVASVRDGNPSVGSGRSIELHVAWLNQVVAEWHLEQAEYDAAE